MYIVQYIHIPKVFEIFPFFFIGFSLDEFVARYGARVRSSKRVRV